MGSMTDPLGEEKDDTGSGIVVYASRRERLRRSG